MKLIIDQGNTRTKLALFQGKELKEKCSFLKSEQNKINNKIKSWKGNCQQAIVSSVTEQLISLDDIIVHPYNSATPLPIINKYSTPKTLGLDRLANVVGAYSLQANSNSLVIDIGTCIKYDLINQKNEYLGGNISPGIQLRYNALNNYTDKLPLLNPESADFNYGNDTVSSIFNGVQQGIYHEINGFIQRYSSQFNDLTIFMTGGDAKYFDKEYKNSIFADSNLTLIGLNEILDYNAE